MLKSISAIAAMSMCAIALTSPVAAAELTTDAQALSEAQCAVQIAQKNEKQRTVVVVDSFSFGVEREMKESGEKGGTEDINIGVGELQECTISKS